MPPPYIPCVPSPVALLSTLSTAPSLVQVGRDQRPVMRADYECFRTGAGPEGITQAAAPAMLLGGHDAFYSQVGE